MPPNSVVEWMIGQNIPRRKKCPAKHDIIKIAVSTDDESGDDTLSVTYPRQPGKGTAVRKKSSIKKVRFDAAATKPKSPSSSSEVIYTESSLEESSSIMETDTSEGDARSSDEVSSSDFSGRAKKPGDTKSKNTCKKDEVVDSTDEEYDEPHPTCPCDECIAGRRRQRKAKKAKEKSASDRSEGTGSADDSKKSQRKKRKNSTGKKDKTPETDKTTSTDPTEATKTGEDTEADSSDEPLAKKSKKRAKHGKADTKTRGEAEPKEGDAGGDGEQAVAAKDTLSSVLRQPNLLMPVKARVLQVEHAVETPDDPRPNAFVDDEHGIIRVYHGPAYGNPTGALYPHRVYSGKAPSPGVPHPLHNPYFWGFDQTGLPANHPNRPSEGPVYSAGFLHAPMPYRMPHASSPAQAEHSFPNAGAGFTGLNPTTFNNLPALDENQVKTPFDTGYTGFNKDASEKGKPTETSNNVGPATSGVASWVEKFRAVTNSGSGSNKSSDKSKGSKNKDKSNMVNGGGWENPAGTKSWGVDNMNNHSTGDNWPSGGGGGWGTTSAENKNGTDKKNGGWGTSWGTENADGGAAWEGNGFGTSSKPASHPSADKAAGGGDGAGVGWKANANGGGKDNAWNGNGAKTSSKLASNKADNVPAGGGGWNASAWNSSPKPGSAAGGWKSGTSEHGGDHDWNNNALSGGWDGNVGHTMPGAWNGSQSARSNKAGSNRSVSQQYGDGWDNNVGVTNWNDIPDRDAGQNQGASHSNHGDGRDNGNWGTGGNSNWRNNGSQWGKGPAVTPGSPTGERKVSSGSHRSAQGAGGGSGGGNYSWGDDNNNNFGTKGPTWKSSSGKSNGNNAGPSWGDPSAAQSTLGTTNW
ncbi:hypothetical protein NKR23_g2450 [Pleurostoma richardsiae]|uniref:Uncharacterized protein n=1 Tax=Pleurostoma richardsiae TaxID=41990 RepID=A0AA38SAT9_9PEZI|nr:hypothetical protein NKR23_g2450 [Pleurostoma richardsiae]